jgi:NAD(P)-dependent dehydrogenase (short-subunit alcohol dehydrogenase family)
VQAAELERYGITANAIAPSARTRMTEVVFADIAPLVVWLGSAESRDVTGRCFEISGGKLSIADGWRQGPEIDRGKRWEPDEVGAAVHELLGKAVPPQKVYGT